MKKRRITKRDASIVVYNKHKIEKAILSAAYDISPAEIPDVSKVIKHIDQLVSDLMTVETIQDITISTLRTYGFTKIASCYQRYRNNKSIIRNAHPDNTALRDYVFTAKYARTKKHSLIKETWSETCHRVMDMHCRKYPLLTSEIITVFQRSVITGKVIPSARSLQFAGPAIETHNERIYNCSATAANRQSYFSDLLFILLCGCGVGISIQRCHVKQLPEIKHISRKVLHYSIDDSIEGWANAVKMLFTCYMQTGDYVEFDYSSIRPEGSPLITSGGNAPGHLGLKKSLEQVREILNQSCERKLRPIEVADITCIIADAVLSGGIRRASLWIGFDSDDGEMMTYKTGDWLSKHLYRKNTNISAYILRDSPRKREFDRVIESAKQYGDPGFYFSNSPDYIPNPCVEVGMHPFYGKEAGFSFCNLTERVMPAVSNEEESLQASKDAAFIGTLQAGYTNFPFLGNVTERIVQRDALIGVSMTGMMDNYDLSFDTEHMKKCAKAIKEENQRVASLIGIRSAARTTLIKPSGTLSLAVPDGPMSQGIHPHESKQVMRRIIAKENESAFRLLCNKNPQAVKRSIIDPTNYIITFPIINNGKTWSDFTAIEFLKHILDTQINYVIPGRNQRIALDHNVSCTIKVKNDEWGKVTKFIWDNKDKLTAVAMFPDMGMFRHPEAPYQIITEEDTSEWNKLVQMWNDVDYQQPIEKDSIQNLSFGCEGLKCEM